MPGRQGRKGAMVPCEDNAAVSIPAFLPGEEEAGMAWAGCRSLLRISITEEVTPLAACRLRL